MEVTPSAPEGSRGRPCKPRGWPAAPQQAEGKQGLQLRAGSVPPAPVSPCGLFWDSERKDACLPSDGLSVVSDRLTAVSVPYEGGREPPRWSANLQRKREDRASERGAASLWRGWYVVPV